MKRYIYNYTVVRRLKRDMAVYLFIFYGKIEMHVVQDQENGVFLLTCKVIQT
jgi:hypothetical protein